MKISIPVLRMPDNLRSSLRIPLSTLYVSPGQIKNLNAEYCVGDIVAKNQECKYMVIDGKTLRETHVRLEDRYKVINPPGTLSLNILTSIKNRDLKKLFVMGEEDLIVLGIGKEYKTTIIYGQPNTGIVIINSNPYWIINVIKAFKPDIVVYE